MVQPQQLEIAVITHTIIAKASSPQSNFKDVDEKKLTHWVYPFRSRHNRTIRMQTNTEQKLNSHISEIKQNSGNNLASHFKQNDKYKNLQRIKFVNMGEIAVYFVTKPMRTVRPTGFNTKWTRVLESNNHRVAACAAVASNGTTLSLFVIFKGQPTVNIEKHLQNIFLKSIHRFFLSKSWAD